MVDAANRNAEFVQDLTGTTRTFGFIGSIPTRIRWALQDLRSALSRGSLMRVIGSGSEKSVLYISKSAPRPAMTFDEYMKYMNPEKYPNQPLISLCPSCGGVRDEFADGSGSYCRAEDKYWRFQ